MPPNGKWERFRGLFEDPEAFFQIVEQTFRGRKRADEKMTEFLEALRFDVKMGKLTAPIAPEVFRCRLKISCGKSQRHAQGGELLR